MPSLPLKPEYGPTLGGLLWPRWRRASALRRVVAVAVALAVVAVVVGAALTLQDAKVSFHGPVPFNFRYRGLNRTAPAPGGYARVARYRGSRLEDSFAVGPLHLPPYSGALTGVLPLYAAGRIRTLAATVPAFDFQGEGKWRVNNVPAYTIAYSTRLDGQTAFVREVLLLPDRPGVRDGVDIVMTTRPNATVTAPTLVGSAGALQLPFRSFYFGA